MYAYSKENSINRETEFVFDIKLPVDYKPVNTDGEVDSFYLMNIDEVCLFEFFQDIWYYFKS